MSEQVQGAGPSVSVKIEKGQRNTYAWECRANVLCRPGQTYEDAFHEAITALTVADDRLRSEYGGEGESK